MLKNKRIIITGAARGLGRALAEAAADNGAQVVIADILEEQGRETAAGLSEKGYQAHFVGLDLADPESVQNCADQAISLLGGLDGLVNNGAIATAIGGKTMEEIEIDTWDRVMTVNVPASASSAAARPPQPAVSRRRFYPSRPYRYCRPQLSVEAWRASMRACLRADRKRSARFLRR